RTLYVVAMLIVWSYRVLSMSPMPFGDGQMRPLISFICHAWWLAPSCDPAFSTMSTHFCALSRQYAQPLKDALRNLLAVSAFEPSLSHLSEANTWSWSIAVPTDGSLKSMTFRSAGW